MSKKSFIEVTTRSGAFLLNVNQIKSILPFGNKSKIYLTDDSELETHEDYDYFKSHLIS